MTDHNPTHETVADVLAETRKSAELHERYGTAPLPGELGALADRIERAIANTVTQRDALWQLLDDIDTQDDASKGDDAHFRRAVYQIQRKRFDIWSPEGNLPPAVEAGGCAFAEEFYAAFPESPNPSQSTSGIRKQIEAALNACGIDARADLPDWQIADALMAHIEGKPIPLLPKSVAKASGCAPDGMAMVPARMFVSPEQWEAAQTTFGGPGSNEGEPFHDCTLWVGEIENDDGTTTYGLHVCCDECPEEGSITLSEFPATVTPPASASDDHGDFIADVARSLGCPSEDEACLIAIDRLKAKASAPPEDVAAYLRSEGLLGENDDNCVPAIRVVVEDRIRLAKLAASAPEVMDMLALALGAWRAGITLGNNICVQESDRENDQDGDSGWINGTAECAKRIREWAEPEDAQLIELLNEAGVDTSALTAALQERHDAANNVKKYTITAGHIEDREPCTVCLDRNCNGECCNDL